MSSTKFEANFKLTIRTKFALNFLQISRLLNSFINNKTIQKFKNHYHFKKGVCNWKLKRLTTKTVKLS